MMRFAGHPSRHEQDLTLTFQGVRSVLPDDEMQSQVSGQASVLLDELRPTARGFDYELAFAGGSAVHISAQDLSATWA